MLKEERFRYILEKLRLNSRVLSQALSQELGVSDDTIRRDLHQLAEEGLIEKVHGGAIPKSTLSPDYRQRQKIAIPEKKVLAQKALKLLEHHQTIILDGGTTNLALARSLPPDLQATVFTNGLPIALALSNHPTVEVILLGGKLFKLSQVTVGLEAITALENVRADICILGVGSIHTEIGLTVPDREEAQVKHKMVEASTRIVALATEDKINTADHYVVCAYHDLSVLIVEDGLNPNLLRGYEEQGVNIL